MNKPSANCLAHGTLDYWACMNCARYNSHLGEAHESCKEDFELVVEGVHFEIKCKNFTNGKESE